MWNVVNVTTSEKILEGKSTEFYDLTQKLKKSNFKLEKLIADPNFICFLN